MPLNKVKAVLLVLALVLASAVGVFGVPSVGPLKDMVLSAWRGAPPPSQIGQVKTASGSVSITHGGERLAAKPGFRIYQGDVVETGADGSIGITLIDDSMFSAGPNSRLALPEFRFDFNTSKGNMLAELKQGTLAVVSGEITHAKPGAMSIKTPTVILGVRGTTVAVEVAASAQEGDPDERYVVLPNADGRPGAGAITVNRGGTATTLDQPYAAAEWRAGTANAVAMNEEQAQAIFRQAIAARPALPAHFRLNFLLDSDQMTPESQALFHSVVAEIVKRPTYEVELVGHTDTLADEAHNQRLSRDRAVAIRQALIGGGVSQDAIAVIARGESELLIQTQRGVAEPRNRRVEVTIR